MGFHEIFLRGKSFCGQNVEGITVTKLTMAILYPPSTTQPSRVKSPDVYLLSEVVDHRLLYGPIRTQQISFARDHLYISDSF